MILVDNALEKKELEGKPIRVGMVGAGFMAQGVALQILKYTKGIRLVAIANRTLQKAEKAYEQGGVKKTTTVTTVAKLDSVIRKGTYAITDDAMLLCESKQIDVILEITGAIEFGAHVVMSAIEHKKHILLMNAELDGTIGPIMKTYADRAGVVYTFVDGDQPGVTMNLYRFVKGIGVTPVLCGNIKGLHDPYRNPTTQESFAKKWGQKPHMVSSFADGTKVSFEQAIIANGTGMKVGKRGMYGPTVPTDTSIEEAIKLFDAKELMEGPGIVDYVVGAKPNPGVFVLGTIDDPIQKHYLNLYKLGTGPLYCFYTPYHLCHFEVPNTIGRAALFHDATLAPLGKPYVEVITVAKKDLKKGETIDGLGYYMTYGLCENSDTARAENLLPIGLAEGCILKNDIPKDKALTFDDVQLPNNRLCDKLWNEQKKYFQK